MANTGAPHFIPFVEPTDLVREYPAADEASAFAVAAALDAAGGLVAVHSAIETEVFSASVAELSGVAIGDLSIPDVAVSDAANRLIIYGYVGLAMGVTNQTFGIAPFDGTNYIGRGTNVGNRHATTAGGKDDQAASFVVAHAPGDTTPRTYSLHILSVRGNGQTMRVNRQQSDDDIASRQRTSSGLIIFEVKV